MLAPDDLERIAAAVHPDPHAVLGPHASPAGVVVRAFRPDAATVRLLPDDARFEAQWMTRVHPAGVFEAEVRGASLPFAYRFEVKTAATELLVRDAYAFSPITIEAPLRVTTLDEADAVCARMGAHVRLIEHGDGISGTSFAVWAPFAKRVSVSADFNEWNGQIHTMRRNDDGVWELFVPDVGEGALYKFEVLSSEGALLMKSDPYARATELRPNNASKVYVSHHCFEDDAWMNARRGVSVRRAPISIYEVHLGSFKKHPAKEGETDPAKQWLSYRELADVLVDHVKDLGFTHVELLPVMEHPFDGSWGYQISGYFAPTSRYGTPDDFRYFVDRCHQKGIGVLLDWTAAHFPKDAAALGRFDGTALYEHLDPRQGEHKHWGTFIYNYGRPEVRAFLLSNAIYWLEAFHVDGLRVDAVASMLYLDYSSQQPGEWVPNQFGGRENLDAVAFLRDLNDLVHERFPGAIMTAEESTTWPAVTRPTYVGGLGFDFKWNMGWMHDSLDYFALDPIHRAFHHQLLTFGIMYAFSERFLLPLSHDEVVHLKKSLLSKMPGDRWKMHANLRSLYGYMWAHPGKKLLFMGGEIGQYKEWDFAGELDWDLLDHADHRGLGRLLKDLNALYVKYPALHEVDDDLEGFLWIDANDSIQSVASFVRFPKQPPTPPRAANAPKPKIKPKPKGVHVVFVGNFTPVPRYGYRLGVPRRCRYLEVMNSDARDYGGSGLGNLGGCKIEDVPSHGFPQSIVATLPPLSVLYFVPELDEDPPEAKLPEETEEPIAPPVSAEELR